MATTEPTQEAMVVTDKDRPVGSRSCIVCLERDEHKPDCWLGQLHTGRRSSVPPGV